MSNLDLRVVEIMHGDTTVLKIMKGDVEKWPNLPYDAQVEYLQGDGTAYIDTLIKAAYNIKVETQIEILTSAVGNSFAIYGARIAANNSSNVLIYLNSSNKSFSWRYGNEEKFLTHNGVTGNFTTSNVSQARTMVIGGALSGNVSCSSSNFTTNLNIYIFAQNNGGSVASGASTMHLRIKSQKMYSGSTLVRDYIPVRKNSIGYLYDKVSGELFGNAAGSGAFTYGNDV